jgi:hypothetical protein
MFTEAIEDHLALKKQNAYLDSTMPIARFDVGDPLDRYPGAITRPATDADIDMAAEEQGEVVAGAFRTPLEQMNGMTPMLSLVEDVEDEDSLTPAPIAVGSDDQVVRFPGAVGVERDEAPTYFPAADGDAALAPPPITEPFQTPSDASDTPVIVIDTDEPLAPLGGNIDSTVMTAPPAQARKSRFSLRRKKKDQPSGQGWFADSPRDFNWD